MRIISFVLVSLLTTLVYAHDSVDGDKSKYVDGKKAAAVLPPKTIPAGDTGNVWNCRKILVPDYCSEGTGCTLRLGLEHSLYDAVDVYSATVFAEHKDMKGNSAHKVDGRYMKIVPHGKAAPSTDVVIGGTQATARKIFYMHPKRWTYLSNYNADGILPEGIFDFCANTGITVTLDMTNN